MICFGKPVPTFPDHAFGNKKAPVFSDGASDQGDAIFDYARTPPEPPKGLVLVVALVVVIMGPDLWARLKGPSTDFAAKCGQCRVEQDAMITR
jgi:hypothetical protein